MELFKLFGSIMIDNKKANESISETDSRASKLVHGFKKGIKTAAVMGTALTGMAVAGGTALFGMANKAAASGDRVDKLSQKVGMSRKGFQEWDYILSQNGMSIESLQGGMKKLNNTIDDAIGGSKTAVNAFGRIGISVDDLKGKSPEQVFEMTVKALQGMPDGAEKAALANELLGRSGSELMPLLNGSSKSVDELKAKAKELGIVLSDDSIDASVKFTDTLDSLKRSLGAVVTKVGVAVMPIMQKAADWVIANMPTIQMVMGTVFKYIGQFVSAAVDVFQTYFLPVLQFIFNWIRDNWPQISNFIGTVFNLIKDIIHQATEAIKVIWDLFGEHIMAAVELVWGIIKEVITNLLNIIRGIILAVTSLIKGDWSGVWEGIKMIFAAVWDNIKTIVSTAIGLVKQIILIALQAIGALFSSIWNGILNLISNIWDGIINKIKSVLNSIKSVITGIFSEIKGVVSNVWNGIKDTISNAISGAFNVVSNIIGRIKGLFNFKFQWPHIPLPHFSISGSANPLKWITQGVPKLHVSWYAKGAIFDKPTIFDTMSGLKGVGEAGPEAVAPISKLQDYVSQAVSSNLAETELIMSKILSLLERYIPGIAAESGHTIVLDDGTLVGKITPAIARDLANLEKLGMRGI
ncbi:MAG: hypothetical protein HXM02_02695 [[Eubacterium] sulci]|nr:hypothetical protein [[Eubacterium] sulci]